MVSTETRTPEEVDRAEAPTPAVAALIALTIAETSWSQNILSNEKWKTVQFSNSQLLKQGIDLLNTRSSRMLFQYSAQTKNYGGLDEVLCTGYDQVEVDFMPSYPDIALWAHTQQIQIANVTDGAALVVGWTTEHVFTYELVNKTIITNANLQKQLLSDYEPNSKLKSQEYSKFLQEKKSLISILYG